MEECANVVFRLGFAKLIVDISLETGIFSFDFFKFNLGTISNGCPVIGSAGDC